MGGRGVPGDRQGVKGESPKPFEGKQDLQKQLMRKIRAYTNQHARFIVIQDQLSFPDGRVLKA
jgi:hypothetical protein